ncbi:MAG: ABC transporter substrate-binding protein [Silicimonas sp.]|nr:ABC transporter substrate-binding protein [Silicimonas sp.]
MQKRPSRAVAATPEVSWCCRITFGVLSIGAFFIGAGHAWSESHENIIVSHGYNEYDELKYSPGDPHLEYVNPNAPVGGEISLPAIGTFDSMNPYATGIGNWGMFSTIGYEDMMVGTSDEVGSIYCLLCETIEYPESRDWVVFNMRRDVMFSDGEKMTAEDVLFSFELLKEQGTPSYAAFVKQAVAKAELLDEYTLKFTFADGFPRRSLIETMGSLPAFPQHWYEETGARLDESRLEIGPGTGEYVLDSLDAGRQIIYARNPDYWGKDHYLKRGHGNYDRIRVEYFGDSSAAFEAFKAGEYTFRRENSSLNWATRYDFPGVRNGTVIKEELPDGALPGATGFVFNMFRDKFADRNVRRALGEVFNFEWTNENLQYGLFFHRASFWENDRLRATGLPEGDELALLEAYRAQLPEAIFTEEVFVPNSGSSRPRDRAAIRRALALMEQAGYSPGDDGLLRDADGSTLDIEIIEDQQSFDRIILPYVENLKALGVNVVYDRIDPAQYQNRRQSNDYDILFGGYGSGLIEGSGLEQKYGCEDREDIFNPANYCNPVVDELAKVVVEAETYDELATAVRAIDRIMRYDYFIVPVWALQKNWVAYYDMYEYPENLPEFGLGHLEYWWINQEKLDSLRAAGALK